MTRSPQESTTAGRAVAPWSADFHDVRLFGTEDGIHAYVYLECCEVAEMSAWHTSDGHSWSEMDPPSFLDGSDHAK